MYRAICVASATVIIILSSGCASIVSGHNQPVSVETPGCSPANCQLTNAKGSWFVTTPGSVTVRRAYGDMTVECKKEGLQPVSRQVQSSTKAMAFGNILFGGIIGASVDVGTGAAYDYPPVISVSLICDANKAVTTDKAAKADAVTALPAATTAPAASITPDTAPNTQPTNVEPKK